MNEDNKTGSGRQSTANQTNAPWPADGWKLASFDTWNNTGPQAGAGPFHRSSLDPAEIARKIGKNKSNQMNRARWI